MGDFASRPMFRASRAAQRYDQEADLQSALERPEALAELLFQADGGRDGTPRAGASQGDAEGSSAGGRRAGSHSRSRSFAQSFSQTDTTGSLARMLASVRERDSKHRHGNAMRPPSMHKSQTQPAAAHGNAMHTNDVPIAGRGVSFSGT